MDPPPKSPSKSDSSNASSVASTKNLGIADVQITEDQLMYEAFQSRQQESKNDAPQVQDLDQLKDYLIHERQKYELKIQYAPNNAAHYIRYANFEERFKALKNARSIYERALKQGALPDMYIRYAEFEIRNEAVNHARNVFIRAIKHYPKESKIWYKYILMEEILKNTKNVIDIFEQWLASSPPASVYTSYIQFHTNRRNYTEARSIYNRYLLAYPNIDTFIQYAKFEENIHQFSNSEKIYLRAIHELSLTSLPTWSNLTDPETVKFNHQTYQDLGKLFPQFAYFKQRRGSFQESKALFEYALCRLPPSYAQDPYKMFINFLKKFAPPEDLQLYSIGKQRHDFEAKIAENTRDYSTWISYLTLDEKTTFVNNQRDLYERAISHYPKKIQNNDSTEQHDAFAWSQYVYIWYNYAAYEELIQKDSVRTEQICRLLLAIIPHNEISLPGPWIFCAKFFIRQKNLTTFRAILSKTKKFSLNKSTLEEIFLFWIGIEKQLGNYPYCRTLYEDFLVQFPSSQDFWISYAKFEASLGEKQRSQGIIRIAERYIS